MELKCLNNREYELKEFSRKLKVKQPFSFLFLKLHISSLSSEQQIHSAMNLVLERSCCILNIRFYSAACEY